MPEVNISAMNEHLAVISPNFALIFTQIFDRVGFCLKM
jgi:hypothetical protein